MARERTSSCCNVVAPVVAPPAAFRAGLHRAGMGTMEVMIAMMVLAVALASVSEAIFTAHRTVRSTAAEAAVLQQVEAAIEEIQTVPFAEVPGFDGVTMDVPGVDPPDGVAAPLTIAVDSPSAEVCRVVVSAAWQDLSGPRSASFTYLHVNRGG